VSHKLDTSLMGAEHPTLHSSVNFFLATASREVLGPRQLPIQWVSGALSTEVKRPECEAGHSPPPSAEVKNSWSYTSTPPHVFMAWHSVKHSMRPHGVVLS
jgi:hypothetical protein